MDWRENRPSLDTVANVAVILAAVVTLWVTLRPARSTRVVSVPSYEIGQRVTGLDSLPKDSASLVLIVQSRCRFCTASMGFYKKLQHSERSARIVVAGAEPEGVLRQYTSQHGFAPDQVLSYSAGTVHVRGTPTLLLLDSNRTVLKIWQGQLDEAGEREVLENLRKRS